MELKSRIIGSEQVEWKKLVWLQGDGFKEIFRDDLDKLKKSISENGFIQAFNVWIDKISGIYYILDGHHRKKAIEELCDEGKLVIPNRLDVNIIDCVDRKEAAKFVLLYSSEYAHITKSGLDEFAEIEGIDIDDILGEINIEPYEMDLEEIDDVDGDGDIDDVDAEDDTKIVKLKLGDVVTVSNKFLEIDFKFENKKGMALRPEQEIVFLRIVRGAQKVMKGSCFYLNGTECSFVDLGEGF